MTNDIESKSLSFNFLYETIKKLLIHIQNQIGRSLFN